MRAPRITLVTDGASLTHAKATSRGEYPSPSAATHTASTICDCFSVKYGSTKEEKCGVAALESLGIPFRYLPVRTPRPKGDHARKPTSRLLTASIKSSSTLRFRSEYSFCKVVIGALLAITSCLVMARALCHPEKFDTPTYLAFPLVYA